MINDILLEDIHYQFKENDIDDILYLVNTPSYVGGIGLSSYNLNKMAKMDMKIVNVIQDVGL